VDSVAISPDGRTIVSVSDDASIKEWDLTTGSCLRTLIGPSVMRVGSVAISPDGRTIVSFDGSISVFEGDNCESGDVTEAFVPRQRRWMRLKGAMATPRHSHGLAVVNNGTVMIALGGVDRGGSGSRLATVERYDIFKDEWDASALPPLATPREAPAAVAVDMANGEQVRLRPEAPACRGGARAVG
jgi:WD40 repeat protein